MSNDKMAEARHDGFVAIINGEFGFWYPRGDLDTFLSDCQGHILDYIYEFLDHTLPLRVTPELARRLDIRTYQLNKTSDLLHPEWVQQQLDEAYEEHKKEIAEGLRRHTERAALNALEHGVTVEDPAPAMWEGPLMYYARFKRCKKGSVEEQTNDWFSKNTIDIARLKTPTGALAYWWEVYEQLKEKALEKLDG
jgi:hypothetical protein